MKTVGRDDRLVASIDAASVALKELSECVVKEQRAREKAAAALKQVITVIRCSTRETRG
jgi:hypothetical protein